MARLTPGWRSHALPQHTNRPNHLRHHPVAAGLVPPGGGGSTCKNSSLAAGDRLNLEPNAGSAGTNVCQDVKVSEAGLMTMQVGASDSYWCW